MIPFTKIQANNNIDVPDNFNFVRFGEDEAANLEGPNDALFIYGLTMTEYFDVAIDYENSMFLFYPVDEKLRLMLLGALNDDEDYLEIVDLVTTLFNDQYENTKDMLENDYYYTFIHPDFDYDKDNEIKESNLILILQDKELIKEFGKQ